MLSRNLFRVYQGLTRSPMRSIPEELQKPLQLQFPSGQLSTTARRMEKKPPEANLKGDNSAPNLRGESPLYNTEKKAEELADKAADKAKGVTKNVKNFFNKLTGGSEKPEVKELRDKLKADAEDGKDKELLTKMKK